jgi:hypothetical protein
MANHGIGTYVAMQKKWISEKNVQDRNQYQFEHRYWHLDEYKQYRWCDESHFAIGLSRTARIHRRYGTENRERLEKTQFKFK